MARTEQPGQRYLVWPPKVRAADDLDGGGDRGG